MDHIDGISNYKYLSAYTCNMIVSSSGKKISSLG